MDFGTALNALPVGTFTGTANGKRYVATKSSFAGGKSIKLVAEELSGPDYISLNWYDLATGPKLKPCEMPAAKVTTFVLALKPDTHAH
ncbi:hypothetical protein [uncultured Tateyamaria sp.]|uniref:hypothetical protein n=1 Tax=uncultured Tateyamaria sp. TaxID=455651 RepID=UPI002615B5D2|nr:hypothetical protein [uncultured Tateyamaria sp.]